MGRFPDKDEIDFKELAFSLPKEPHESMCLGIRNEILDYTFWEAIQLLYEMKDMWLRNWSQCHDVAEETDREAKIQNLFDWTVYEEGQQKPRRTIENKDERITHRAESIFKLQISFQNIFLRDLAEMISSLPEYQELHESQNVDGVDVDRFVDDLDEFVNHNFRKFLQLSMSNFEQLLREKFHTLDGDVERDKVDGDIGQPKVLENCLVQHLSPLSI